MIGALRRLAASVAFYPVTCTYLTASGLAATVAAGRLRGDVAFALLTLVVITILLGATRREVGTIHQLVNHQHDEMVDTINRMSARIGQLLRALHRADVPVPDDDTGADDDR